MGAPYNAKVNLEAKLRIIIALEIIGWQQIFTQHGKTHENYWPLSKDNHEEFGVLAPSSRKKSPPALG